MLCCILHVFLQVRRGWSDALDRSHPFGLVNTHEKTPCPVCIVFLLCGALGGCFGRVLVVFWGCWSMELVGLWSFRVDRANLS